MSLFYFRGDLKSFIRRQPVSSVIIFLNTIALIITILTGGFTRFNLFRLGAIYAPAIAAGEYYRLLAAMFLHGSLIHYLTNTFFGLAILGAALERLIGGLKFLFVYFLTGIISSFIIYLTSSSYNLTIGASGAIYGLLGVFLFIIIFKKELIPYNSRIEIRNLILINIIFTIVVPLISITGHISGLLTGFIISPLILFKE